jgi:hypothetical protein
MSLPLIQQGKPAPLYLPPKALNYLSANSWIGYAFCYIVIMVIYYTNTWNVSPNPKVPCCIPMLNFNSMYQSLDFPMLSSSIFSSNGSIYRQSAVFGSHFVLNETALEEVGLPALTGSNAWNNLTANLAVCYQ